MCAHNHLNFNFSIVETEIKKNTRDPAQRADMIAVSFIIFNDLVSQGERKISEIGNVVGYIISAAARIIRHENQPVALCSLDEEDENGKPIHQIHNTENDNEWEDLEAQQPVEIQELADFLRREGLAGIARKNGCSLRNAQRKFKQLVEQTRDKNIGLQGLQGDFFFGRGV